MTAPKRPPGRPRVHRDAPRQRITVWLEADEMARVEIAAWADGAPVSAWVRAMVLGALLERASPDYRMRLIAALDNLAARENNGAAELLPRVMSFESIRDRIVKP